MTTLTQTISTPHQPLTHNLAEENLPERKIWTEAEFMALSADGHHYELVDGELVDMGDSGAKHGHICSLLMITLGSYVHSQKLGAMFDSSTAFRMQNGNKRSPDISFVSKEKLRGLEEMPDGFLDGAPDLAIEVLSPGNTVAEMHHKLVEYFQSGTRLAWVIHPQASYVLVYRSPHPDRLLKSTDSLEGEEVAPGFTMLLSELFQQPSF
jgi:Uma2 family endonuclease